MTTRKIELEKIALRTLKAERIAVFPHTGADGDCLGAGSALREALTSVGVYATVVVDAPVVSRYKFLPFSDEAVVYNEDDPQGFMRSVVGSDTADLAILVDCSIPERIGNCSVLLDMCDERAVIDHHFSETCSVKFCCIDDQASSTGELIFDFIESLEVLTGKKIFSRSIAVNILAAIYFDTGGLRYSNTTSKAFDICGRLFREFSPDLRGIVYNIFEKTSKSKICIQSKAFSLIEYYENSRIAVCKLTGPMISECGADDDDMDGICTSIKNVEGVEVAFVLRERDENEIRGNIRSSELFDASKLASSFGGGGHRRAAGFTVTNMSIEEIGRVIVTMSIDKLRAGQDGSK